MSFQPVLPLSGYAGWSFLKKTQVRQEASFNASPVMAQNATHFHEKIAEVQTADALLNDRRLLNVALGAFGLESDIGNHYFIRRVLEDGTTDGEALANRLSDKRYLALSRAFGFGDQAVPHTSDTKKAEEIVARWQRQAFEQAVGDVDDNLRLALNAERELAELGKSEGTEATVWFTILGSPPLRKVFETAFGLPPGFGGIDLDQQLAVMQEKAKRLTGDEGATQFAQAGPQQKLIQNFLMRSQVNAALAQGMSRGAVALRLLQGG